MPRPRRSGMERQFSAHDGEANPARPRDAVASSSNWRRTMDATFVGTRDLGVFGRVARRATE